MNSTGKPLPASLSLEEVKYSKDFSNIMYEHYKYDEHLIFLHMHELKDAVMLEVSVSLSRAIHTLH